MTGPSRRFAARLAMSVLAAPLLAFYLAGASAHGRRMNPSRARADQSG